VVVLDFSGDARVAVDGGNPHRHGSRVRYAPRRSAFVVDLPAGSHELEVRLATLGGPAQMSLLVLPLLAGESIADPVDGAAHGAHPAADDGADATNSLAAPSTGEASRLRLFCDALRADL